MKIPQMCQALRNSRSNRSISCRFYFYPKQNRQEIDLMIRGIKKKKKYIIINTLVVRFYLFLYVLITRVRNIDLVFYAINYFFPCSFTHSVHPFACSKCSKDILNTVHVLNNLIITFSFVKSENPIL